MFAYTYMDPCIRQVGWDNWGKVENERSACFYEYRYSFSCLILNSLYVKTCMKVLFIEFEV